MKRMMHIRLGHDPKGTSRHSERMRVTNPHVRKFDRLGKHPPLNGPTSRSDHQRVEGSAGKGVKIGTFKQRALARLPLTD